METVWDTDSHVHFDDIEVAGELHLIPPPPLPPNWTNVFKSDFEDGLAEAWNLGPGWGVQQENGNYILSGEGHQWAVPLVDGWVDCVIESRIKLVTGGVHLSFRKSERRISDSERIPARYFLGLGEDWIYLGKQMGSNFSTLFQSQIYLDLGSWHLVRFFWRERLSEFTWITS